MAVHSSHFNGLKVTTGDIICTTDGDENSLLGQFWKMLGRLVPGDVDHCVVYLGPGGRCAESGPQGVIVYEMPAEEWNAPQLWEQRLILDTFYGIAYPLAGRGLSAALEKQFRLRVADYCLYQAAQSKPYNLNFFDPHRDGSFYCSQLVYKAYLSVKIDIVANYAIHVGPPDSVVFPQEIFNACPHLRPGKA
jgi:hypothetical protein